MPRRRIRASNVVLRWATAASYWCREVGDPRRARTPLRAWRKPPSPLRVSLQCRRDQQQLLPPASPGYVERWAASVPGYFRFAIKMLKTITHELRLADCAAPLQRFAAEIAGLAEKRGPILVQPPPKLAFDFPLADRFFTQARQILGDPIVCEPRHPSSFTDQADVLLADHNIPRVAADPPLTPAAADPGGALDLAYFRLHGAPRTDWSTIQPRPSAATSTASAPAPLTAVKPGRSSTSPRRSHAPANALTLLDDLDGSPPRSHFFCEHAAASISAGRLPSCDARAVRHRLPRQADGHRDRETVQPFRDARSPIGPARRPVRATNGQAR